MCEMDDGVGAGDERFSVSFFPCILDAFCIQFHTLINIFSFTIDWHFQGVTLSAAASISSNLYVCTAAAAVLCQLFSHTGGTTPCCGMECCHVIPLASYRVYTLGMNY